jgi:hypothetical protein
MDKVQKPSDSEESPYTYREWNPGLPALIKVISLSSDATINFPPFISISVLNCKLIYRRAKAV